MTPDVLARLIVNPGDAREVARRSLIWLAEYQAARSECFRGDRTETRASLEGGAVLDETTPLAAKRALA